MNKQRFSDLIESGYNHIPVFAEILSDLETPLSLFMKLANQPYSYLLESVQGGEQWARYSMLGLSCQDRIEITEHNVKEISNNVVINEQQLDDPLEFINEYMMRYKTPELAELPKFQGGLVGYFGYDCIHLIEPNLQTSTQIDELQIPDILLLLSKEVVVMDNLSGKVYIIIMTEPTITAYEKSQQRIKEILSALTNNVIDSQPLTINQNDKDLDIRYTTDKTTFLASIAKIKQYIVDGDAFQVVPSQRMSLDFDKKPLDLYRSLRMLNPSPYMFYLHLDNFHIVGASPEILVRYEDGIAQVRPIAGTRKRGKTHAEDLALEAELLSDEKELAEHLMLIDLGRNDIGRIAKAGKVNVDEQFIIERYSHVMHIVSNVTGEVKDNLSAIDVFKSVFPAGTLSGAPKFRAMDIITEIEPVKRNIYGGAIGYMSWQGNMDTAIAIRTAVIKDKQIYIQAGAGIVYDSEPESEWQETLNKAQSIIKAIKLLG